MLVALLGLAGLFLASAAGHGGFYEAGLLLAAFAFIFDLMLIRRAYSKRRAANARGSAMARLQS